MPKLDGGDLLIVAGDLTASDKIHQYEQFVIWINAQDYKKKIVIAGNHDNALKDEAEGLFKWAANTEYLCDTGTEFEGMKIWGSPWSLWFPEINKHCKAFTCTEIQMRQHLLRIPTDIDILVTHGPPFGILDDVRDRACQCDYDCYKPTGSDTLRNMVLDGSYFPKLKLHVFGHIHEQGGKIFETTLCKFVNASILNEDYKYVNKPVRIIL